MGRRSQARWSHPTISPVLHLNPEEPTIHTNPKRKRGNDFRTSLALRVSVSRNREQYRISLGQPEMNESVAAENRSEYIASRGGLHGVGRSGRRLRDLTPSQWRSGIAAWLGWMFDGLDMHLYTVVALPFVAELLQTDIHDPLVGYRSSLIQAAFLLGWAVGGGFFGRLGDRLGRARALMLTILTYALFTGLSSLAQTWWHLLIFRFLAALGIGGEWAVGAALLSETWPRRWRPWIAAVLQTAVNVGIVLAMAAVWLLSSSASATAPSS